MRLNLRLSPSLQQTIAGKLEVELKGETLQGCITAGINSYPEINDILFQGTHINPQILLFHNNTVIKSKDFHNVITDGDVLDVIPAIEAG